MMEVMEMMAPMVLYVHTRSRTHQPLANSYYCVCRTDKMVMRDRLTTMGMMACMERTPLLLTRYQC